MRKPASENRAPEFFTTDGKGRVFVALQDKNQIAVVDFKTKKLTGTWPVDCQAPTGMYYEEKSDRLFTSCRGAKPVMAVVDPNSGKTVTTIPIGTNTDAVLWNPVEKLVMSPNGSSGTLSIIGSGNSHTFTGAVSLNNNLTLDNLTANTSTFSTGTWTEGGVAALTITKGTGIGTVTISSGRLGSGSIFLRNRPTSTSILRS